MAEGGERYAPPAENDTGFYARHVAQILDVGTDEPVRIDDPDRLRLIVGAIIHHENGACPYPAAVIHEGVARALAS